MISSYMQKFPGVGNRWFTNHSGLKVIGRDAVFGHEVPIASALKEHIKVAISQTSCDVEAKSHFSVSFPITH